MRNLPHPPWTPCISDPRFCRGAVVVWELQHPLWTPWSRVWHRLCAAPVNRRPPYPYPTLSTWLFPRRRTASHDSARLCRPWISCIRTPPPLCAAMPAPMFRCWQRACSERDRLCQCWASLSLDRRLLSTAVPARHSHLSSWIFCIWAPCFHLTALHVAG